MMKDAPQNDDVHIPPTLKLSVDIEGKLYRLNLAIHPFIFAQPVIGKLACSEPIFF